MVCQKPNDFNGFRIKKKFNYFFRILSKDNMTPLFVVSQVQ